MPIIMSLLLLYSCNKLNEMDHINVIFINKLFGLSKLYHFNIWIIMYTKKEIL